jgi:hypothetical protein
MPSKTSQHIAFFVVLIVSVIFHRYVYANLKRVLLRDYPKLGRRLVRIARWTFIALDAPFIFMYFRNLISGDLIMLTRLILYPFLIWQTVMLMWAVILVPFSIIRREKMGVAYIKRWIRNRKISKMDNDKFPKPDLELV